MLNSIVLVGRLTRDPENRATNNGTSVASFTLASDDRRGGQKNTLFIPVTVFGKQAEFVCKYFNKGSLIGVVGRLTQRKYTNKAGVEVTSTEIVAERVDFVDSKGSNSSENDSGYTPDTPYGGSVKSQGNSSVSSGLDPVLSDDLPF